jgi:5-methylcytosine-specific restriction endonuclease McrA
MKRVSKTCQICGAEILLKPSHAAKAGTYCSVDCMAVGYTSRMTGKNNPNFRDAGRKICQSCGKEFRSYEKTRKLCSMACAVKWRKALAAKKREIRPRVIAKLPILHRKSCQRCGVLMYAQRHGELSKRRYCTKRCAGLSVDNRQFLAKRNALQVKMQSACTVCGSQYPCSPSRRKQKKTCSKKCSGIRRRENQRGERSHRWKGGRTSQVMLMRTSIEYKAWRTAVFERDRYACQMCGKTGGRLTVHHIKTVSERPDLTLEVWNGITLCWEPCHTSIKRQEPLFEDRFYSITMREAQLTAAT